MLLTTFDPDFFTQFMTPSTESDQLLSHFVYPPGSVELLDFQSELPEDWPESLLQLSTQLQHISDVFFALMLQETESLCQRKLPLKTEIEVRLERIIRYFDLFIQTYSELARTFSPGIKPVTPPPFFPGSGKVSLRFRMLELSLAPVLNLVHPDFKNLDKSEGLDELLKRAHWNGPDLASHNHIKEDSDTYSFLLEFARQKKELNLWDRLRGLNWESPENLGLKRLLRQLDEMANIAWPATLKHIWRSISGSEAQMELHQIPRLSKVVFFPDLWQPEELEVWGKLATPKTTVKPF